MSCLRAILAGLLVTGVPVAWAQMYPSITALGRQADIVACATVERVTDVRSKTGPDATLTVELRITKAIKGQFDSPTISVDMAEKCYLGGGGPGWLCVYPKPDVAGETGLWFLKLNGGSYQILPRNRVTHRFDELFLPLPAPPEMKDGAESLDDQLPADLVTWYRSAPGANYPSPEAVLSYSFEYDNADHRREVLTAVAPLIRSPYPRQHAAGLIVALRADSPDAMTQVVDELPGLRPNPQFPQILAAISESKKDLRWLTPLGRLVALHTDIPGVDAAAAGALYRLNAKEAWPLIAELLDSKDPGAQMIAVRTLALQIPEATATEERRKFFPGMRAETPLKTPDYVIFWKQWWSDNHARLGLPLLADAARVPSSPHVDSPLPPPFINKDGIVRSDTTRPGILSPGLVFSIYGHNFGPASGCHGAATELCGVEVLLDGKPIEVQFTTDTLINARTPDSMPITLISQLTAVSGGRTSDPVQVQRLPGTVTIALEGVARVDGPVWIHVELPGSAGVSYPAMDLPWDFGCVEFEVRRDGKLLAPLPHPAPGMVYVGPPCRGISAFYDKINSHLPLHLQYDFNQPGAYEIRLSQYDGLSHVANNVRAQSPWTSITVLPAAPRTAAGDRPNDRARIVSGFLPNLLARRDDTAIAVLLDYLYHPDERVRNYAAYALYYWPDSVIERRAVETMRTKGPTRLMVQRFGADISRFAESAMPYLASDDPVLEQGAIMAATEALGKLSPVSPELQTRLRQALIDASGKLGHLDGQTTVDLVAALSALRSPQAHDLLWSLVDRNISPVVALSGIVRQKDVGDLPRLAAYLIATARDYQPGYQLQGVVSSMYSQFGDAGLPWLRSVLEKASSPILQSLCAEELMRANDRAAFAFTLDAIANNRAWKARMKTRVNSQFPETRNDSDAQLEEFLRARAGQ